MIVTMIPYCPSNRDGGKNLGFAYNVSMGYLHENDWACFIDHDACFTTPGWYRQLEKIVAGIQGPALLTAVTNRVWCPWQRVPGIEGDNHCMKYHRGVGGQRAREYGAQIKSIENVAENGRWLSGVLMLLSKRTWRRLGGFSDGFLGVDNQLHQAAEAQKCPVYLMLGVYVYHWYRAKAESSAPP